ncbi:MAG: glycosyltransferase [Cyclobacteriaceae bacterium]|nr:glycosyltransferase [Cyclobacteriaceae bacterium]
MEFDIVICTLNRPDRLQNLLQQIFQCTTLPIKVIVVDASAIDNDSLRSNPKIEYIRSSHQNQPYQRYVGYLASDAEIIVFMDDDLEIVDSRIFDKLTETYGVYKPDGVSVGIQYESAISEKLNNTIDSSTFLFRSINLISGVPLLRPGRIYPAGLAGPDLKSLGEVDFFHGPFMSFKRDIMGEAFDPCLFTLYEMKLGKGEDKALSMKIGLSGKIIYVPDLYLKHPPVESHYFKNPKNYSKRLSYSRFFLSKVYAESRKYPTWIFSMHYIYFMIWRILLASGRFLWKGNRTQYDLLKGMIIGFWLALTTNPCRSNTLDWYHKATMDAKSN